jgi:NAD(P)-dependent dehydrogenase (short-subunit alcohol dehydrogenase family)
MDMEGRIALVTGGARRLGRALALGLADAGCDVVIAHGDSPDEARNTVADIEALGRRAAALQADLSVSGDVRRLAADATAAFGGIDILVNSAARFDSKPVLEISAAEWDLVQAVNVRAPFLLSQAVTPTMRERGAGVIINIADLSGLQPWSGYAHHAVSKAALLHLTKVLARALAPQIRVNAIAPGTVLPPDGNAGSDAQSERRVLTRHGTPDDVVSALLYLVRSDWVTGETLIVDGGRTLL